LRNVYPWLVSGGLVLVSGQGLALDLDDLTELSLAQLSQLQVAIATGAPKALTEAPAGTSVITAADIKAMGALTVDQALESVPGLHVSRSSLNYAPRYFFRGIVSSYNPQALMLVNGVPMSRLFFGDRGERIPNQYSFPIKAVERIEIIRGPGSALYGADAFAGVINIITRDASSLSDTEVSASYGSFDTKRASLAQPFDVAGAKGAFFLSYQETDGDEDVVIKSDVQSNLDSLQLGPPASYAPESAQLQSTFYDARVDLAWDDFRVRAGWRRAWDVGNGYGTSQALDPNSEYAYEDGTLDLTWRKENVLQDLDLDAQLSYLHSYLESDRQVMLFPPNTIFPPATSTAFPDGVKGLPTLAEENARFNLKAIYRGFDRHLLTLGSGYYWGDLYKTTDFRNYQFVPGNPFPIPLVPQQNVADTDMVFQPEAQRTSYYVFAQDEWEMLERLTLTAGWRFDKYDDVGSSVNPRAALVWKTTSTLTSKLIYGEAFRVPVFSELYTQSNPVALGNEELAPEKLHNVELAFAWQPTETFSSELNIYRFRISDYIDFVPDAGSSTFTAQNIGRIEGKGAEVEVRYALSSSLRLLANYSLQETRDRVSDEPVGIAPDDKAYLRVQWEQGSWLVAPQVTYIGSRQRQVNDPRPDLEGYTTFDLTARRALSDSMNVALIVRNLAGEDVIEPSRGPATPAQLPSIYYDLPQEGRSVTVEMEASF